MAQLIQLIKVTPKSRPQVQISGHPGRPTLAESVNGSSIKEELPHSEICMQMVRAFHAVNFETFSHLKPQILAEVEKVIPRSEWPTDLKGCDRMQRNVADFIFHDVQTYTANACQWHLQSLRDVIWSTEENQWVSIDPPAVASTVAMAIMPEHHDGGRAFVVWAIGLWTQRILRVWDSDGNHKDLQTFSGHTYFARF